MKKTPHIHKSVTLIAFGANGGTSVKMNARRITASRQALERLFPGRWDHASLWKSPAWPPGSGPDFVNSVSILHRVVQPVRILRHLHSLEARAGRRRVIRWGPRALDLDLLAVGPLVHPHRETVRNWMTMAPAEQAQKTPEGLLLPHPRLHDRAFVLAPLCEIAPFWRHPVTGQSAKAMLASLPAVRRAGVKPLGIAL